MAYYALPPSIDDRHPAVAAWFLGPQAENFDILKGIFESTLDDQRHARKTLYPKDEPFITKKMQESTLFTDNITKLEDELRALSKMLSQHSIPFWSARYQAHMNMDTSFPAVLGCKYLYAVHSSG